MAALHDHDCYEGMEAGKYLERSASAMRASIVSGVPVAHNNIDKHIRLVLTDKGPEYWSLSKLKGGAYRAGVLVTCTTRTSSVRLSSRRC